MTTIWSIIARIIADIASAIFRDKQANSNAQDLGAAKAQAQTDALIKSIADEQSKNNAAYRDLGTVIDRLRRNPSTAGS